MIAVTLTPEEMEFAAIFGALRRSRALIRGLTDRYGVVTADPWSIDVEGVGAELAVAKALRRYYVPALRKQTTGDVGTYEVRSTQRPDGDLVIKDGDADDRYFILVTGRIPNVCIAGWLQGRDGKRDEWRRSVGGRPAAWWVPQSALKSRDQDRLPI